MGALHDALEESGYKGHALERFLVRLLFCLFADDTGIFQPLGIFEEFIANTREDGAEIGAVLSQLFQVLNTPEDARHKTLSAELAKFPYVNGDLFAESLPQPSFDRDMREKLLNVCGFRWEAISPAIFGSLFQSVLNKEERRKRGAHYTSEKNILKVIEPLFMDDLKAEFARLKARRDTGRANALKDFQDRLSKLTFFDPACGCGNFLVIAYRELRELELNTLLEIRYRSLGTIDAFDAAALSKVNVDQFYGIEIEEFPARIAEVAMWMTDHIMNVRLSAAFGQSYLRIPLTTSPNIRQADALEVDWADVLPPEKCSFVFGNPPFSGQSFQSPFQRAQMQRIFGGGSGRGGSVDYVCAWFVRAGEYVQNSRARIAFVATNSITQGEQVAQLWPLLFERYALEIAFAHRTFAWLSDARGSAHVHCVILGITRRDDEPKEKRLFSYSEVAGDPVESRHAALSPYLVDAGGLTTRYLVVRESRTSLCMAKTMRMGSKIVDDGLYIFNDDEKREFLSKEPDARLLFRPLVGSDEFINGLKRWILRLDGVSPSSLRTMPFVMERISRVRNYRKASRKAKTRELAETPTAFEVTTIPNRPFLAVPKVSSERREYIPVGWLSPPTIPSQLVQIILDADYWDFAIVTSRMHMAWMRFVGGRLESRYQYSIGIVYNAFPWPAPTDEKNQEKIRVLAQAVINARENHADATLADLYDPDAMPADLRKAHMALDVAVDRLYRKEPFLSDRERVEHLFKLYENLTAPVLAAAATPRSRRRPRKSTDA